MHPELSSTTLKEARTLISKLMAESESLRENGQREKAIRLENAAMKIEIEVATMVAVPINEDRTWKIVDQFSEEIDFSDIEEAVKSAKELLKQ